MTQCSHTVGYANRSTGPTHSSVFYIEDHNPIWLTLKDADTMPNGHTLLESPYHLLSERAQIIFTYFERRAPLLQAEF